MREREFRGSVEPGLEMVGGAVLVGGRRVGTVVSWEPVMSQPDLSLVPTLARARPQRTLNLSLDLDAMSNDELERLARAIGIGG